MIALGETAQLIVPTDPREPLPRDDYNAILIAYLRRVERVARDLVAWETSYNIFRDPRSVQIQIDWLRHELAHVDHVRNTYRPEEGGDKP